MNAAVRVSWNVQPLQKLAMYGLDGVQGHARMRWLACPCPFHAVADGYSPCHDLSDPVQRSWRALRKTKEARQRLHETIPKKPHPLPKVLPHGVQDKACKGFS